jgi:hypothetical protein
LNHAPGLAIWFALGLTILLFKENQDRRSLYVLAPIVAVYAIWMGIKAWAKMPSNTSCVSNDVVTSLTMGLGVVLLMGKRLGRQSRWGTLFLGTVVLVFVCGVVTISEGLTGARTPGLGMFVFVAIPMGVVLSAFGLAGFLCRRRFNMPRFTITLAVLLGFCIVVPALCFDILLVHRGSLQMTSLLHVLRGTFWVWAVLCCLLLPYMVLALGNSFFRERFLALFGPDRAQPAAAGSGKRPEEREVESAH